MTERHLRAMQRFGLATNQSFVEEARRLQHLHALMLQLKHDVRQEPIDAKSLLQLLIAFVDNAGFNRLRRYAVEPRSISFFYRPVPGSNAKQLNVALLLQFARETLQKAMRGLQRDMDHFVRRVWRRFAQSDAAQAFQTTEDAIVAHVLRDPQRYLDQPPELWLRGVLRAPSTTPMPVLTPLPTQTKESSERDLQTYFWQ